MSPTGEGAVSLSLEKVHVKRDHGVAEVWAAGSGTRPRAAGPLPVEGLTALGTWSLSCSLASPRGF